MIAFRLCREEEEEEEDRVGTLSSQEDRLGSLSSRDALLLRRSSYSGDAVFNRVL